MFKIGEFSKITQVSIRMLRYYDEQKLLIPYEVDELSGYRLYSAEQIEHLNKIVLLRNMGFGVKEIKQLLKSWNPKLLKVNLQEQMKKTEENIKLEQNRLQQLKGYIMDLDNQDKRLNIQIVMKQIPEQYVISIRRIVPDYYCEASLWEEMDNKLSGVIKIDVSSCFSIYHDLDYREQEVDIEVCMAIDHEYRNADKNLVYRCVEKVDMAACFMIYGSYSNISIAYREFAFWLEQHKEYCMSGENRQICHVSSFNTHNPQEYITELQIPLKYSKV